MCMLYLALASTFWGDIFKPLYPGRPKEGSLPLFSTNPGMSPILCPTARQNCNMAKINFSTVLLITPLHTLFFFPFSADSGFSLRFKEEMGCGQLKKCSQGHKINYRNCIHNDRASVGAAAPSMFAMKTDNNSMYLLFSVSSTSSGLGHLPLDSL